MASWVRQVDSSSYETAEFIVSAIIPIVLIIVGTFGNLACVFILLKKENRHTSTNVYLIFLCIMDTLSLYQWNLTYVVYEFTNGKQQITDQSLFLCKAVEFLAFYTLHTSAMFLTLVSFDRACLLWSRSYKRKIARARLAFIFCIVILLVLIGVDGFLLGLGIEFTNYDVSTGIQTTVVACYYSLNNNLNEFFANQYAWIHLVIMYIVPFTVMLLCTVMTVKKLTIRQTTDNEQLANSAQRNRRISIMLLLMCLCYVVLTLPNRLCFSVFTSQIIGHDYTDTVFLSTNTLMYTRNALNAFFLYLSVHGFRRHIRRLMSKVYEKLTCRAAHLQNNGVQHLGTTMVVHSPTMHRIAPMPTPIQP